MGCGSSSESKDRSTSSKKQGDATTSKKLEDEFQKADADGNGFIDFPEFLTAKSKDNKLASLTEEEIADLKDEFSSDWDTSGRGMINFDEFLAAKAKGKSLCPVVSNIESNDVSTSSKLQGDASTSKSHDKNLEEFQQADVDGNGFIDFPEFLSAKIRDITASFPAGHIAELKEEFSSHWDTSGRGMINFEEFLAAKAKGKSLCPEVGKIVTATVVEEENSNMEFNNNNNNNALF